MESALKPRVCIIGSGNVATHLAKALDGCVEIVQIYSHSKANALTLSSQLSSGPEAVDNIADICDYADFYIVSVKDDCVADVAAHTPDAGIWAHTSGSVSMSVFAPFKKRYGVFYPLQTFSKNIPLDLGEVPFFIEGSDSDTADALMSLAGHLSPLVEFADSERRKALHVAAVFACNFVNYMWIHADELLKKEGLDISYMMPLLKETLRKIDNASPADAQTGPARRGDSGIIDGHLSMLDGERADIYEHMSRYILNRYKR